MPSLPPFRDDSSSRCLVCGKRIGQRDDALRLRGNTRVHKRCATYDVRRRRYGSERLGYPPR
jgi:hypothetical protein